MALTQDCLITYCTSFACKIAALSNKYYKALEVGSECAGEYLYQITVAVALLNQICDIDLEEETCLSETDICQIIDKLTYILNEPCNCE